MTWIETIMRELDEDYLHRLEKSSPFDINKLGARIKLKLYEAFQVGKIEGERERRDKLTRDLYLHLVTQYDSLTHALERARLAANVFEPERHTLTVIASPYAGDRERNDAYMRRAIKDSIARGESPYVPHAIFPLVLPDDVAESREKSIELGARWLTSASRLAVYADLGVSEGMRQEIERAGAFGCPVERRYLDRKGCEDE